MKRVLLCFLLLCCITCVWADMPGNKPRESVNVIVRLGNLEGYSIYYSGSYASSYKDTRIKDSLVHILQGGFGAPPCIAFFGVNKQEQHTDTLTLCNEEQGNLILTLSVENGKLISEERSFRKQEIVPIGQDNPDDGSGSIFFRNKINILVLSAFTAVLLLVGLYFMTQRKKHAV